MSIPFWILLIFFIEYIFIIYVENTGFAGPMIYFNGTHCLYFNIDLFWFLKLNPTSDE